MSGHSKWATTKHRKGAKDQARAKVFAKLIRQVEVAAREGGGDVNANATLRTMFTKARDASVPIDTIERAIKRGTGELEGVRYEAISYEGYAPSGVALIVEVLTDNRNRTGADIRSIFSRNGGSMAEPGAVSWQFERKGVVMLPKTVGEDDLMAVAVEAGAEDLRDEGNEWMLTCAPGDLPSLRQALEAASIEIEAGDVEMAATTRVAVEDEGTAKRVLKLIELLDDHDDVQNVWANFDIPDHILESIEV
jgi:YebC/PmpR family DNA-binding regulatory protein